MENLLENNLKIDELGNPNGILLVDKEKGITSHDIVNILRRVLKTKKVGHAGTLDPFATGLMIMLIGKATKLSNEFLTLDKEYEADLLLGIETDSGDIEGSIFKNIYSGDELSNIDAKVKNRNVIAKTENEIQDVLQSFTPKYLQSVPLFSSVKVNGEKLRKLARRYDHFETIKENDKKIVNFFNTDNENVNSVELPSKVINIYNIELLSLENEKFKAIKDDYSLNENFSKLVSDLDFQVARIKVRCSKGTYIRQLAVDIGEKLGTFGMLVGLRRTTIGEYKVNDAIKSNELKSNETEKQA